MGRVTAAIHEAERAATLEARERCRELDELRTLVHDLLIDRDASVGREAGRGEALAVAEGALRREEERAQQLHPLTEYEGTLYFGTANTLEALITSIRALGPVRPLPPPERLAARARALEGALRDVLAKVLDWQWWSAEPVPVADLRALIVRLREALGEGVPPEG